MKSAVSNRRNLKQVGVWIDYSKANIIFLINDDVDLVTIPSNVNPGKLKGGHRSKTPYGPMDVVSESKHIEKRKHELNSFYDSICKEIMDCDDIFIMGPAEAKIGLRKHMSKNRSLYIKLKGVTTVDSITENQKVERVRTFFSNI